MTVKLSHLWNVRNLEPRSKEFGTNTGPEPQRKLTLTWTSYLWHFTTGMTPVWDSFPIQEVSFSKVRTGAVTIWRKVSKNRLAFFRRLKRKVISSKYAARCFALILCHV